MMKRYLYFACSFMLAAISPALCSEAINMQREQQLIKLNKEKNKEEGKLSELRNQLASIQASIDAEQKRADYIAQLQKKLETAAAQPNPLEYIMIHMIDPIKSHIYGVINNYYDQNLWNTLVIQEVPNAINKLLAEVKSNNVIAQASLSKSLVSKLLTHGAVQPVHDSDGLKKIIVQYKTRMSNIGALVNAGIAHYLDEFPQLKVAFDKPAHDYIDTPTAQPLKQYIADTITRALDSALYKGMEELQKKFGALAS